MPNWSLLQKTAMPWTGWYTVHRPLHSCSVDATVFQAVYDSQVVRHLGVTSEITSMICMLNYCFLWFSRDNLPSQEKKKKKKKRDEKKTKRKEKKRKEKKRKEKKRKEKKRKERKEKKEKKRKEKKRKEKRNVNSSKINFIVENVSILNKP
ncbi:hypothetical protein llap_8008 [Limosa lapponica baueri]|uniref:Uncharacterized protein n=1 Tax=Limosa lapponica baueri TaxID=1758121 RepID=A0A2I0U6J3_LIMLA|nr:hypothetical protein llap_8008 [Limosa lapponica baueri]